MELNDSFADRFAIIGVAGYKTALQCGSELDRSHRRGPLFRRGRVRFVYWDQEEATEVAEASESAHHFEPSCCRGARAIRRGPASTGGGTGATGAGGAGVGVGVGVAGFSTGKSAPSFLGSSIFFGLIYIRSMWVDLISGHDFFGQALVPRFTAAVADAVARARAGAAERPARGRTRTPQAPRSPFLYLLASPTLALSTVNFGVK